MALAVFCDRLTSYRLDIVMTDLDVENLNRRMDELRPVLEDELSDLDDETELFPDEIHPVFETELVSDETAIEQFIPEQEDDEPVPKEIDDKPKVFKPRERVPTRYAALQKEFEEKKAREERMKKKTVEEPKKEIKGVVSDNTQMRKVKIGGRYRYVPVVVDSKIEEAVVNEEPVSEVKKEFVNRSKNPVVVETEEKKRKIPTTYAKIINDEMRKKIEKNAKSISELQRLQCEHELTDIDSGTISIKDLRRMRDEKREREREKALNEGRKDSILKEIMRDDSRSEFSKLLEINRLSKMQVVKRPQSLGKN